MTTELPTTGQLLRLYKATAVNIMPAVDVFDVVDRWHLIQITHSDVPHYSVGELRVAYGNMVEGVYFTSAYRP